jgi:hypothetical protein
VTQSDLPVAGPKAIEAASRATAPSASFVFGIFLVTVLTSVVMFRGAILQTPKDALSEVFRGVVAPVGLSTATSMIDTNTWLTARWDRSLVESFRTGKVSASVDIVGSLPDYAINAAAFDERQTYLDLFKAGKLHRVAEHATLTFERHGLDWRLTGVTPEQVSAQARTAAYLAHAAHGPITFEADKGVYADERVYSSARVDETYFRGAGGVPLALGMLLMGALIGIVKKAYMPVFTGVTGALFITFAPAVLVGVIELGAPALASAQAWGIFG